MPAKMTLIGLYNYDSTIFDSLDIPRDEDNNPIWDKQTFIESCLLHNGEFEILYTNPDFLKYAIGIWSRENKWSFERMFRAINLEYNPIENYNRTEKETFKHGHTIDNKGTNTKSNTFTTIDKNGNASEIETEESFDNYATEHQVSAYDSPSSYSAKDKDIQTGKRTVKEKQKITQSNSETEKPDLKETHSGTDTREVNMFGNIGTTTSQMMLQSELDIAMFSAYLVMCDSFADSFCVKVFI